MARRQRTSPLEDLITVASKFPWWMSAVLALFSYLVLHAMAARPIMPPTVTPGQMGDAAVKGLFTTLAMFGQLVFPFAFILAAGISFIRSIEQRKLYDTVKSRSDVASLNEMTWEDFETVVGEHYRRNGFKVSREGGSGPDGGVDLMLRRGNEKYLVQCKQWKAYKVGVQPVREFYGVMAATGAAGGYFVTSGVYTDDAKAFVQGLNLELVDGKKLKAMIAAVGRIESLPFVEERPSVSPSHSMSPSCPKCGAEMKVRVARQGINAGKEFWGCSTFPGCNGTRVMEGVVAGEPAVPSIVSPEKRSCPDCGSELLLKKFQSGPKEGQEFYGCVPCKKGWPIS